MKKYLNIILVILAWSLSLVNTSGWGLAYDTPTKTNLFIAIWFLIIYKKKNISRMLRTNKLLVRFTILSFIILPLITAGSWDGFTYLMMVPLVYCFSETKISKRDIQVSGLIIASLGLLVLYIFNHTSILSGWNYNHISMIGLFSYIYYSISLYGNLTGRKLTFGLGVSFLYMTMLNSMSSRSGIIFIIIAFLFAYRGEFFRNMIFRKKFLCYALNVPLIISFVFILIPDLFIFQYFEEWSVENYGKSAFNGRDELWAIAYKRLQSSFFIGEGKFLINYHNSAVAAMSVFGVIGYLCWYKLLAKPMKIMKVYVNDNLMFGFVSSFFLIFWQQSFELGFITAFPNMIPYMILGLGVSRAKSIRLEM